MLIKFNGLTRSLNVRRHSGGSRNPDIKEISFAYENKCVFFREIDRFWILAFASMTKRLILCINLWGSISAKLPLHLEKYK